ncbi:hypothetical protein DITRI_Ditri19aG0193400 [Diplodiscus trichospermus]
MGASFVPEKKKVIEWKDYIRMQYTNEVDALEHWPVEIRDMARVSEDSKIDALIQKKMINMNFYPTCCNPDLTVRVGRYSDVGTLIVLLQDGIGGLHVKIEEDIDFGKEGIVDKDPSYS